MKRMMGLMMIAALLCGCDKKKPESTTTAVEHRVVEAAREMASQPEKPPSPPEQGHGNLLQSLQKAQDFADRMERLRQKMERRSRETAHSPTSQPAARQVTRTLVPSLPPEEGDF